jgi:hypothetical protein
MEHTEFFPALLGNIDLPFKVKDVVNIKKTPTGTPTIVLADGTAFYLIIDKVDPEDILDEQSEESVWSDEPLEDFDYTEED